jgi:hypothetical protein
MVIKNNKVASAFKIFWGLAFIAIAIYFLLLAFGINIDFNIVILAAGIFLLSIVIKSLICLEWFGVFSPIALFITLFNEAIARWVGVETIKIWQIWLATIALSIGLSALFRPRKRCRNSNEFVTSFSQANRRLKAEEIKDVDVLIRFGGEKIYIDNGKFPKNASINFDLSCAGVELFVPKNINIVDNLHKNLSGISEKNYPDGKTTQNLTLKGYLSLAGIEIHYI